ncbi:MAG: MotE family protein [Lachnospiraceae bacterium]
MAKNNKNVSDGLDEDGERRGGGLIGVLIAFVIVIIWLLVFALLVKMDVGGFGTNVMRPLIKDVPVINSILPNVSDDNVAAENDYRYKTLYDAIERIKELEQQAAIKDEQLATDAETIEDLRSEISRLKVFEENQLTYEALKKKFDEEVVFTDKAPDINEYKSWYEQIYPENAAELYIKVLERLNYSQKVKDWAATYSKMEASAAAAILEEMTGDLDLVTQILLNMNATQRANILAAMDPVFAAKITHVMYPE